MSFYRMFITAVATCALASTVFAADTSNTQNPQSQQALKVADAQSADQAAPAAEQKVDLNKGTKKELMTVKGINSAKAKSIISYRKKHGDFKSLDDLKQVKGFTKMNDDQLKAIEDQLTIG